MVHLVVDNRRRTLHILSIHVIFLCLLPWCAQHLAIAIRLFESSTMDIVEIKDVNHPLTLVVLNHTHPLPP